jgi:hypothetical protein
MALKPLATRTTQIALPLESKHLSPLQVNPSKLQIKGNTHVSINIHPTPDGQFSNLKEAALKWFSLGYLPVPVREGTKKPRVKVKEWLQTLTQQTIEQHWAIFENDDIGLYCSNGLVALDSDAPESLAAMAALENAHGIKPLISVKTKKGTHHYFKLGEGVRLKQTGSSTELNPEYIDIRSENSYIIAPPSTDKILHSESICPLENLEVISQEFADALVRHNGGTPENKEEKALQTHAEFSNDEPRMVKNPLAKPVIKEDDSFKIASLRAMLNQLDPDESYNTWFKSLMIIHHETNGSDQGLVLADEWSSQGSLYKGTREIESKWESFAGYSGAPLTEATLSMMLKERGVDSLELKAQVMEDLEPFEVCATEIIKSASQKSKLPPFGSSLKQYSLLGKLDIVRKFAVDATPLLGSIALKGQFTVLYADSNAGKTLLTLHLLREAILGGRIEGDKVFYANMDDSSSGLLGKGEIAEELGFHQLAIGYQDLTKDRFLEGVRDMIQTREASGTLLVLDTLKKFTDVMSKSESSEFAQLMREFTAVGGSALGLAHTNKNRDREGQLVQTGTADIPQDADCTYILDTEVKNSETVVTFKNTKSRGPVPRFAQFAYDRHERNYCKLLDSVRELAVDESSLDFEIVPEENPNDRMIRAIKEVIGSGFNGKTNLINEAYALTKDSKSKLEKIYLRYVGSDPTKHIWGFTVGERNLQSFFLHPNSTALDPKPASKSVAQDDSISLDHEDIMDDEPDDKLDD